MDLTSSMVGDRVEVNRRPGKKLQKKKLQKKMCNLCKQTNEIEKKYPMPSNYKNLMFACDFGFEWDSKTGKVTLRVLRIGDFPVPFKVKTKEQLEKMAQDWYIWKACLQVVAENIGKKDMCDEDPS